MPAEAVFALHRQGTALAGGHHRGPLNSPAAWGPANFLGDLPRRDLRETILHMRTETACHAGQLDAACELIDGRTWLVLTG